MQTPVRLTWRVRLRDSVAASGQFTNLVIAALLLALKVVLGGVGIYVTPESRITFGFLATALTALLFGPVLAMVTAGLGDFLSYLLHPVGAYFPGFAVTAVVGGLLYGLVLYERPVRLPRVLLAKVLVTVLCNLGLNVLWKVVYYGQGFWALFPVSVLKNLILLPFEVAMLFAVCKAVPAIYHQVTGRRLNGV